MCALSTTLNLLTAKMVPMNAKTIITGTRSVAKKPRLGSGTGLIAGLLLAFVFSDELSAFGGTGAAVDLSFDGAAVDGIFVVVVAAVVVVTTGAFVEGVDWVEGAGEGGGGDVEWAISRSIQ